MGILTFDICYICAFSTGSTQKSHRRLSALSDLPKTVTLSGFTNETLNGAYELMENDGLNRAVSKFKMYYLKTDGKCIMLCKDIDRDVNDQILGRPWTWSIYSFENGSITDPDPLAQSTYRAETSEDQNRLNSWAPDTTLYQNRLIWASDTKP